ncbi:MAG: hypothetical protein CL472_06110 [Acidobacteria bacterium]|nr:hypothetical protein [Acidobacteriota bacterium]
MSHAQSAVSLMAPVGPVAESFVNDERLITAIMGPYGSAKTTSCIRKAVLMTLWQNPGPDGVRRSRGCIVRDTYGQLETNVLESWFTWFPKDMPGSTWNGRQMRHTVRMRVALMDGQPPVEIEMDVYFRAMGDQKAEDVLKGLELTWLWLNEVDTLDKSVLQFGLPRCGRYPSTKDGGCRWYGVIADFNAPDEDNWTYELLVEQKLPVDEKALEALRAKVGDRYGIGFHKQPGGLEPDAENKRNLPDGYYEGLIASGMPEHHINRFVHNRFGSVFSGQRVFPEYNTEIHRASYELEAKPDLPLLFGLDGGRTPALVIAQLDDELDQLRLLDEVVLYDPEKTTQLRRLGARAFGERCAMVVADRYPECVPGVLFYDPAIDFGTEEDGYDFLAEFLEEFPVERNSPGGDPGNRIEPRLSAVRKRLTRLKGGEPSLLVSPRAKVLHRGYSKRYILERVTIGKGSNATGRFRSIPVKNDESHVCDAAGELMLGLQNRPVMINRLGGWQRGGSMRSQGGKVDYGDGYFAHRGRA